MAAGLLQPVLRPLHLVVVVLVVVMMVMTMIKMGCYSCGCRVTPTCSPPPAPSGGGGGGGDDNDDDDDDNDGMLQLWLQGYSSLFSAPCTKCGKFLQNAMPPTWRDFRTREPFHDGCRQ